ncbi:MAG: sulfatase-like hydrolase/transferase [Gammaproteobacteria bacterium]|jgi:arylsulfatase|nr:sulfatase-like hydrolase/transferase [Gammaproteobacteria bacterium]
MKKTYWFLKPVLAMLLVAVIGGCTKIQSQNGHESAATGDKRPNILIVLADDLGYSDVGAYGSEIETPNIDQLAAQGVQLTNFHVGAACSPTRTMLMTGVDNHLAGLGNMLEIVADNQFGQPGYEGHLNDKVVTVSTLLRDAGYHTYMVGKWHLGKSAGNIPHGRGFDRSFTLMESGADNWVNQSYGPMYERVHYYEDEREVDLPKENYFSTDYYTDRMIEYIESNRQSGKPFFGYVAYQAVHSPHQAPRPFIDKYNGVYDAGWHELRRQRLEGQQKLGIASPDVELAPNFDKTTMYTVDDWDSQSDAEMEFNARRMQVYAGMVDNMDFNIGRLLAYLEEIGEADNTLVIFMSDNGADPTELQYMAPFRPWYEAKYQHTFRDKNFSSGYPELGQKGSFSAYGAGWAAVSNSPATYWKTYSTEGGLRSPFIARFPGKIPAGQISSAFGYVIDVVPTVLEVAGVKRPGSTYSGKSIHAPSGESMWSLLSGSASMIHAPDKSIGYELAGSSAVFQGNFKLVRNLPPKGTGEWELYDIVADPSEMNDLAQEMPDLMASLMEAYSRYEENNNVIPVPDDYDPRKQLQKNARRAKSQ